LSSLGNERQRVRRNVAQPPLDGVQHRQQRPVERPVGLDRDQHGLALGKGQRAARLGL
jgi:hypothetical protein